MNETASISRPLTTPERLALAQQAFQRFHSRCFWFMREDLLVGEEDIEAVIHGLRAHGNREAFLIAARLCR
ncbi:MAG: hypothetical protein ABSC18_00895 [Verrucomicrobiota bacterium]|jgi:hypothetical protein